MSVFQFRYFSVRQEKAAMKIGTDSVLLGCFCETDHAASVLDIGTGTGLLALMLAQKSTAIIDAIEIDPAAFEEAATNVEASPWKERITVFHSSVQDFPAAKKYDVIISNPPYFRQKASFRIEDLQRSKARHDQDLPFETLCDEVVKRLKPDGSFWMILPVAESEQFKKIASANALKLNKEILVYPREGKPHNRVIMCWGKDQQVFYREQFTVYRDHEEPTDAYVTLTKEYYLWKKFSDDERLKW